MRADSWSSGRHELLWNGDIKTEGFTDKWTVFVIARGSGCRLSSSAVSQVPASIRKLASEGRVRNKICVRYTRAWMRGNRAWSQWRIFSSFLLHNKIRENENKSDLIWRKSHFSCVFQGEELFFSPHLPTVSSSNFYVLLRNISSRIANFINGIN